MLTSSPRVATARLGVINQLGLFLEANNLRLTISEAIVSPKSQ
jgi:hypothetical protein